MTRSVLVKVAEIRWIFLTVLLFCLICTVGSLRCYQCSSLTNDDCKQGPFEDKIKIVNCSQKGGKYCVIMKKIDVNGTLLELSRACEKTIFAQVDEEHCMGGKVKGSGSVTICVLGCQNDICNRSTHLQQTSSILAIVVCVMLAIVR